MSQLGFSFTLIYKIITIEVNDAFKHISAFKSKTQLNPGGGIHTLQDRQMNSLFWMWIFRWLILASQQRRRNERQLKKANRCTKLTHPKDQQQTNVFRNLNQIVISNIIWYW